MSVKIYAVGECGDYNSDGNTDALAIVGDEEGKEGVEAGDGRKDSLASRTSKTNPNCHAVCCVPLMFSSVPIPPLVDTPLLTR